MSPSWNENRRLFEMGEEIASTFLNGFWRACIKSTFEGPGFMAGFIEAVEDHVCVRDKVAVIQVEPVVIVNISWLKSVRTTMLHIS